MVKHIKKKNAQNTTSKCSNREDSPEMLRESNANSHEQQDDGIQFTSVPQTDANDSHQPTSVTLQGDDSHQSTSVTLHDDSHQSTSDALHDDSHQFISVTLQDDNHQSAISIVGEGKDDTVQANAMLCPAPPEPPPLPQEPPSARDRGYAWVVVWAVFGLNTLTAGYVKSFGIMYLLLLQHFPDASGAEAGWVMGLLLGSRAILAPFGGALTMKIGGRRSVILGTTLTTIGLLLAIPSFSIYYMALTLGGLVGVGMSMSEAPGPLMVNEYFLERRSTANGFRAAGNPMGGILFPPLLVFLSDQFGLQGTFIMLAGIMLHQAILGTLLRPFEEHERMIHQQYFRTTQQMPGTTTCGSEVMHRHKDKPPNKKKALDFTLFKNPQYLIYLAVALSINFALPNFLAYLPSYLKSVGLTEYEISFITSYTSSIDFVLRMLCGYVTDRLKLNANRVFTIGLAVGGVGCFLVPLCSAVWQIICVTTLYAYGLATFWALLNTLLANQFGAELTASTWGFFRMTQGISSFFYPSLLGLIKDITGGYSVPFFIMGSGFLVGSGVYLLEPLATRMSTK